MNAATPTHFPRTGGLRAQVVEEASGLFLDLFTHAAVPVGRYGLLDGHPVHRREPAAPWEPLAPMAFLALLAAGEDQGGNAVLEFFRTQLASPLPPTVPAGTFLHSLHHE